MRYSPEHKAQTRERILKEAAKTIRRDGVAAVGVASVMADAGLTHGAFYAHFGSRDALVDAALERMYGEIAERFAKVTAELPPDRALAAYLRFYLSPQHRDSMTITCPLPLLVNEVARLGAEARRDFQHGVETLTEALAGPIEALGIGEAREFAGSVVAEMVGAMTLARGIGQRKASDAVLARSRDSILGRLRLDAASL
ncbi:TetR/AcrR family transcriptional regulator [Variovorax sp. CY25R-8]|uniref:TetR/AcrR family transcriptional regulator n=1 Tax=Variovorax sp. CY25R-8 TaxID=2855501 RepID=UPI0021BA5FA8|nr:TetR/AcrR family transcriptional regulator [Variovorax sp. CY25R-8]MCT8178296.1 TetR/AcrR family transcriptional regulator [Variovorax sp. CY25R-8]